MAADMAPMVAMRTVLRRPSLSDMWPRGYCKAAPPMMPKVMKMMTAPVSKPISRP